MIETIPVASICTRGICRRQYPPSEEDIVLAAQVVHDEGDMAKFTEDQLKSLDAYLGNALIEVHMEQRRR